MTFQFLVFLVIGIQTKIAKKKIIIKNDFYLRFKIKKKKKKNIIYTYIYYNKKNKNKNVQ